LAHHGSVLELLLLFYTAGHAVPVALLLRPAYEKSFTLDTANGHKYQIGHSSTNSLRSSYVDFERKKKKEQPSAFSRRKPRQGRSRY
jgi:hypothetical protein